MELTRLVALAVVLSRGLSSPVVIPESQADGPLFFNHLRRDAVSEPEGVTNVQGAQGAVWPRRPARECTTTISESGVNPCITLNEIQTIHPSTSTLYTHVDCNGCSDVYVKKEIYYCPLMTETRQTTVLTPATTVSTVCAPSTALDARDPAFTGAGFHAAASPSRPAPAHPATITSVPTGSATTTTNPRARPRRGPGKKDARDGLDDVASCPTTFVVQPPQSAGSMTTQYEQWATSTVELDCGGCPLVISTALAGYGPAGRFTETLTVPVGTTTVYACQ
ncbi:hypothetical protein QBC33DRAFT_119152 [Phialemonium atrogriseum]|uniref:Uncharacterized protein n=1 Tax=Phialemonium atrogriseum TaxID=1093897 RepID=A0AAJ0BWP4_9PEZI|nr:uncharacterized protein QBC33DRAFT_119152 [Phialemonium atrogriseum]KAK1765864.1 hypothetical protein QBC33DRAFT_119152 [Phialemonium atrogriseum]